MEQGYAFHFQKVNVLGGQSWKAGIQQSRITAFHIHIIISLLKGKQKDEQRDFKFKVTHRLNKNHWFQNWSAS